MTRPLRRRLAGWCVLISWGEGVVEVPAGGDAQFGEHLAEVPFNGAGADEQFRADLAVADLLAGGEQFPASALGEGVGADHGEQVVSGAQLAARVEPPVLATEPLAVEQVGPGKLGPQRCAAKQLDRLGVAALRIVAFAEQRSTARL